MTPELEPDTNLENLNGKKYVMFKDGITIADKGDGESTSHGELVMKGAKRRNIPLSEIDRDQNSKPIVNAAGKIFVENGLVTGFTIASLTTSILDSNEQEALQDVNKLARKILGDTKFLD